MAKNKKPKKRKGLQYVKSPVVKQNNPAPLAYQITINKEGFKKLRYNQEFIQILNLARVTNSLNFCYKSIVDVEQADKPAMQRQLMYAASFANAVLFEGLECARKLEDYFHDYASYQKGFGVLLNDPITKGIMIKGSHFDKMRNRVAYHFNPSIFEDVLTWVDLDSYVFGSGSSKANGDLFYTLPETLAVHFLIGKHDDEKKGLEIYDRMQKEVVYVMTRFFDSAQTLISEALLKKGWKIELLENQTTPQEAK